MISRSKQRRNSDTQILVIASKVKEYIKGKGLSSSGDLPEALTRKLKHILDEAAERTKASKRSTVQSRDI